jgi:hypothetical protein
MCFQILTLNQPSGISSQVTLFPIALNVSHIEIISVFKGKHWKYNLNIDMRTKLMGWLRHYATSRKVAGSIPYGVTGILH